MASPIVQTPTPTWQWLACLVIGALGAVLLLVAAWLFADFSAVKDKLQKLEISQEVLKTDVSFIRKAVERLEQRP